MQKTFYRDTQDHGRIICPVDDTHAKVYVDGVYVGRAPYCPRLIEDHRIGYTMLTAHAVAASNIDPY